ncbi:MAG: hypothetical protein MRZ79_11035 [Bacteroidia bacterium]|nr:hypothetical protein [Bacteroidia bacterium]
MKKGKTDKPTFFQIVSIPYLFVQYLASFALAASLRMLFKPESTRIEKLRPTELNEEEIDPQVMKVVNGYTAGHTSPMKIAS